MSCSPKNTFIVSEYRDTKILDANLFISPITNTSVIQNEEIFAEIGLNILKEKFISTFSKNFIDNLISNSTFKKIEYLNNNTPLELETQFLDLNEKEVFNIDIPKRPIEFDLSGDIFILLLQELNIYFSKKEIESSKPGRKYSITATSGEEAIFNKLKNHDYLITFQTKYVIYNNTQDKIVSYGFVLTEERYDNSKNVEQLIKIAIHTLVKDLLDGTPFNST